MDRDHLFTLFSDINCPFCYALHERLHELHLLDRCAWRGVQHAPYIPIPMKPWQGSLAAELRYEVNVVRGIAPKLPLELPAGKPQYRHAIAIAAEFLKPDRENGMTLVRKIYQAFWVDGRDISHPEILSAIIGSTRSQQSDNTGKRIAERWAAEWVATGQAGVPLLVAPAGDVLIGCVPAETMESCSLITHDGL